MDGLFTMTYDLQVRSLNKSYSVKFADNYLDHISRQNVYLLIDNIHAQQDFEIGKCLYLQADERNKSIEYTQHIFHHLVKSQVSRNHFLVVIGGGFMQDIGTFISSLYKRGISWIYVPTTFMSMLDSCIGGKSSINVGNSKNIIGNFYPPDCVIVDVNFLKTLSRSAIASGLLEGLKIVFARGFTAYECFSEIMEKNFETGFSDSKLIQNLIQISLESKKWFVEIDEFDQDERQLLNFGHTFGHALEASSRFGIPHGIAVGYGMLAALNFSETKLSKNEKTLFNDIVKVLQFSEFPIAPLRSNFDVESFMYFFDLDKKHNESTFSLILSLDSKLRKVKLPKTQETKSRIVRAIMKSLEIS